MPAMADRKPKPARRSRTYRLPEDILDALEGLADDNRRTTTTELEIAIENHLKANGRLPPRLAKPARPKG